MTWITEAKLYKGSKNQKKILAAFQSPINTELVEQLSSYVDPQYKKLTEKQVKPDTVNEVDRDVMEDEGREASESPTRPAPSRGGSSHSSGSSFSHSPAPSAAPSGDSPDFDSDFDSDSSPEPIEPPEELEEDADSSTKLPSSNVTASTYITIEEVSQAVKDIPGLLNIREETNGVTYAALKGGTDNEVWIYYNSDVDINKVLDSVNTVLGMSGYYFLTFNRVMRSDNAIVFTVTWVSSYFNPVQLESVGNER